jgi:nucleolysin TIA-1/TIAR
MGAGAPGTSHMPPPAMPLTIEVPPNTNPIPGVMLSPMNDGQQMMSPQSAGGFVRRAAPEPNKRALYVGGLDPRVTEDMLKQIFQTVGSIMSVKIIPDKNVCRTDGRLRGTQLTWPVQQCDAQELRLC